MSGIFESNNLLLQDHPAVLRLESNRTLWAYFFFLVILLMGLLATAAAWFLFVQPHLDVLPLYVAAYILFCGLVSGGGLAGFLIRTVREVRNRSSIPAADDPLTARDADALIEWAQDRGVTVELRNSVMNHGQPTYSTLEGLFQEMVATLAHQRSVARREMGFSAA